MLEVLYGGAAGGGKSDAALMAAAQYVHVPGYSALLLRENFPDLNQPDALIPRSKDWWRGTDARWNERDRRWTFPSGATVTFGYLDSDDAVYQYQGAAFQLIYTDELTQHTERRYRYLFSRLRKPEAGPLAGVPLRMRGGTNPGGRGHDWVRRRFVDPKTREPGAVFVPARLEDNPSLDAAEYERSLLHVDPLTRRQLLAGDWDAVEGGRFRSEWFGHRYTQRGDYLILRRPGEDRERTYLLWNLPRFITCDPAASANKTADWTVAGVWATTPENELLLLDAERFRLDVPDIVPRLEALWMRWRRPAGVWVEAVAANNAVFKLAGRTPMPARSLNPLGQDKLVRATAAMNYAATGRIWLPTRGLRPEMPLDEIESELYRFTGNDKVDDHDDCVDMVAYAAKILGDGPTPEQRRQAPAVYGGE